jgi:prepilin-type N-terminal cleavage/methylation domain-containing protein
MARAKQSGFTLIEMLMVIVLVAVLSAIAIPQLVDFRSEAKNAATSAALATLRTAIGIQSAQMVMKCRAPAGTLPTIAQISANSVVVPGGPCKPIDIPILANWPFVYRFPDNPWSGPAASAAVRRSVTQCSLNGCLRNGLVACDGSAWGTSTGGWCYNPATGDIWANSNNNGNPAPGAEYSI